MFQIQKLIYFTNTHEWLLLKNNIGIIGLTEYGQKQIGEIVYIEFLLQINTKININQEICLLESIKISTDIRSPINGILCSINISLGKPLSIDKKTNNSIKQYSDINFEFKHIWLFKIKLNNIPNLKKLISKNKYNNLVFF